ncbi:MAG: TMEM175 family protein [Bacteroidia bacterium]
MIRKHLFRRKAESDSVRWRLHEPARIEAFSDALMAFAVTLIVVSLEVPRTFDLLLDSMKGFAGFAICFTLLILIWHDQYLFFRRYGLQDTRTIFYNTVLLFVVLFFVYPLKFLFSYLTLGNKSVTENGEVLKRFSSDEQICQLMIIYGAGYIIIYAMIALMHVHALKLKRELLLSPLEIYNTKTYLRGYSGMIGVGLFSLSLAVSGLCINSSNLAAFSGISYGLIGPVLSIIHAVRNKKITQLFTQKEIETVTNEVVIIEEEETAG